MTLMFKITGYINKFSTAYYEPMSWKEFLKALPSVLIFSAILSILLTLFYYNIIKNKTKKK